MSMVNEIDITCVYVLYVKNSGDNTNEAWVKLYSSTDKKDVKKRFGMYTTAKIEVEKTVVAKTRKTILSK